MSFLDTGCGSGDTSGARSGVGGAAAGGASSGGATSGGAESGAAAGTEENGGGESEVGGTAGGTAAGGAAGSEACEVGEERCDCYPNQTCNGTLRCLSGLCVADVAATGGAAGAGGIATGGEPPEGGAAGSTASQGGTETSGGATSGGDAAGGAAGGPGGVANGGASGGTTSGGAAGSPGGTDTGGTGGSTGGADTGGTGGSTGGATSCFSAPDGIDYGGIVGYAWGYRVVDGIGENADLRADTLALDYTLPGASYEELAMIGFNLNQPKVAGDDPAYGHDVADEVGICVFGTGFDRITVEDDSGGSWCVEHSGCATWDEFTETCWEPGPALPSNAVVFNLDFARPRSRLTGASRFTVRAA